MGYSSGLTPQDVQNIIHHEEGHKKAQWNLAQDLAINPFLANAGFREMPSAEEIYKTLKKLDETKMDKPTKCGEFQSLDQLTRWTEQQIEMLRSDLNRKADKPKRKK